MCLKSVLFCCLLGFAYSRTVPLSTRVIGGNNAKKGEFPYYASLYYGPKSKLKYQCGAVIINKYWVLTAGHCLRQHNITYAKAGKILIRYKEKSEQISRVVKAIVHKDYEGKTSPNDIGLVKFETPLLFNNHVQPIDLPEKYSPVFGNEKVTVCGWGTIDPVEFVQPDVLQKAELLTLDLEICKQKIAAIEEKPIEESNFCTDSQDGVISSCNGDSGGPLVKIKEDGTSELVGIISWGVWPCAYKGSPAVQVKISYFIDWILVILNKN